METQLTRLDLQAGYQISLPKLAPGQHVDLRAVRDELEFLFYYLSDCRRCSSSASLGCCCMWSLTTF